MSASRHTPSPDEFRHVIGHFATGVTVITTIEDGRRFGTTTSALSSLSLEPPMLLVCMNSSSETGGAVARTEGFAVNILGSDQQALARHFAGKRPDKFTEIASVPGPAGQPLLTECLAQLECRVVERLTGGTHIVFIAEVASASVTDGAPLAYFRGRFGTLQLALDAP
jgi:flavin reductase (DIM6/NTAB) family NADH-FMN oxidoreductase RutF